MRFGQSDCGMSLVEIMVTLTMLALAAMAMTRTVAHARATASQAVALNAAWRLASELADWLRTRGDLPLGQLPADPSVLIESLQSTGNCYIRACAAEEAARFFLSDWYRRLHRSVPDAKLVLCQQPSSVPSAAATSRWSCGNSGAPGNGPIDMTQLKLGWRQHGGEREVLPGIELTILHAN